SDATDRTVFERILAALSAREQQGTTLVLVPAARPWSEQWVRETTQRLRRLTSKTSFVRVVFIVDPQTAWQFVGQDGTRSQELLTAGVTTRSLRPWHDDALRQWLDDCRFPSDQQTRANICNVTGNWPLLLQRFHAQTRADTSRWQRSLEALAVALAEPASARALLPAWGLDAADARRVLRDMHLLGDAAPDELAEVCDDLPPGLISRRLTWAARLGLVAPQGAGRW